MIDADKSIKFFLLKHIISSLAGVIKFGRYNKIYNFELLKIFYFQDSKMSKLFFNDFANPFDRRYALPLQCFVLESHFFHFAPASSRPDAHDFYIGHLDLEKSLFIPSGSAEFERHFRDMFT